VAVLQAVSLVLPFMREVVDVRHQFDQPYVIDVSATTATFGLTANPWEDVVRASAAAPAAGTTDRGAAAARH
jgi:hypothetical protein